MEADPKQEPGKVVFFDTNGHFLKAAMVGALPDMLTFTAPTRGLNPKDYRWVRSTAAHTCSSAWNASAASWFTTSAFPANLNSFSNKNNQERYQIDKRFVRSICPKCTAHHNVYMMWTGRGVPRKYCCNCKPLVAGYDDAAMYEASTSPRHSQKKGRSGVSE
ncbi:MAG: hypothetical protein R6V78_08880 [Desulfosarcina sp.]